MKELFNNIISVQFGASIAIVFLLLSRRTMKKHYVAKLRYWLWLIIALRLCLPVDINIQLNRTAPVNIPVSDYYISAQQPQIDGQMTEFEIITADQLNSRPMENTEHTQEIPPVISTVSITDIMYRIWLAVAVLLGVVSVISYILAKRDIMSTAFYDDNLTAYMENLKKQMKISKQVKIAVCNYTGSPMLVGIFSPVIVLPNNEYTATQLEMIIRHELTHLKRNDILYKFILHLVSCVYWFNPLTACMARLAGKDIEISCDEDIVKTGDKQFKVEYAQTIIRVISMQNNKLILATNFSQNAKTVKERFTNIFTNRKLKAGKSVIAVFMAVVVIATSLVGCGVNKNQSDFHTDNSLSIGATRIIRSFGNGDGLYENSHPMEGNEWYFTYISDNGNKFIAKYDLNAELNFVCNKENCEHNTENCTAYIPENMIYHYFNADGHIYAIGFYNRPLNSAEICEITDVGRNTIATLEIGATDNILLSGRTLFITTYTENDGRVTAYVDLLTGETGKFLQNFEAADREAALDISTDGNTVYFSSDTSGDEIARNIYSHNLVTGKVTAVQSVKYSDIWGDDGYWRQDYTVEDNTVYTVNLNTDTFSKYNLTEEGNNETVLISNIGEKMGNAENVRCAGIYDNKLIVDITQNNGKKYGHPQPYAIDLETLEVLPLTNMIAKQSGGITTRCNIFGELGNCFIISTGYEDEMTANIGMISKEDFFANNPQILPLGQYKLF